MEYDEIIDCPKSGGDLCYKLEVTKDGTLKLGALNALPTAITGGLVYSSSAFYMGI